MKKKLIFLTLFAIGIISYSALSYNSIDNYNWLPLDVSTGKVLGASAVDKFGANLAIEVGVAADVWEYGGAYTFDAYGTTKGLYISSSSDNDTGEIVVQGLDINGELVTQTLTLNGQTNVELPISLWRTNRMYNNGNTGEDFEGVIYCHGDATPTAGVPDSADVRAVITANNNQTLMAIYTIPRGYVGFLFRGELGVHLEGNSGALAEFAVVHYESARFEKVFRVKKTITMMIGGGSALYQDPRSFPDVIPALTDVRLRVISVTQDMGIWGAFDILLVDEKNFSDKYLKSIGQPGY